MELDDEFFPLSKNKLKSKMRWDWKRKASIAVISLCESNFRFVMISSNGIFQIRFQSIGYSLVRNCFYHAQRLGGKKCLQCSSSSNCCLQYDCAQPCHVSEWICDKFCARRTKCNPVICLLTRIVLIFRVVMRAHTSEKWKERSYWYAIYPSTAMKVVR